MPKVIVVGGGIAGLAASHLLGQDPAYDVTVLEASDRVGGKLRLEEVAGTPVDVGAEAILNRRPEGVALARDLGLEIVHPAVASSRIWSRGALRPLPRSLMGVPLDLDELAASGLLSEAGLARVRQEPSLPPTRVDGDISVGDLVAARFGDEVTERLVEPLLGGVYAGHAREISTRAAVPQLLDLAERGSLLEGAAGLPTTQSTEERPVFAGIPGGIGRLPEALVSSGRFRVRTGVTVREVHRTATGFVLVAGAATAPERIDADHVVLATPAAPTARLLRDAAPVAAAELEGIETASVAVVTLAVPAPDAPTLAGSDSSGFLVPPEERRAVKASTYSFNKWAWVRSAGRETGEDLLFLRTSLGRHREEAALQATDEELVERSLADLADAVGLTARPVDWHVQRWGGGLPQYAVGHVARVARIRAALGSTTGPGPALAVCGATYDGVGIPAVISSAARAVARVREAAGGAAE